MAKWHGKIGYIDTKETRPGVWTNDVTERHYTGDVLEHSNRWASTQDGTNDNIMLNMQVSIVADPFAYQNCRAMKYIEYMGTNWKITNIRVSRPRLILTIGGVYNGEQA